MINSGSPHQPAGKAHCCWQHRSRKALGLCGCHWSYAIRWIHPMPSSCRGLQTHWAVRPTLGWWAPRCWPRPIQTIGCCWRMTRGNWWDKGGDKWALRPPWRRTGRLRKIQSSYSNMDFSVTSLFGRDQVTFLFLLIGENLMQPYMNWFDLSHKQLTSQHQYVCF